MAVTTTCPLCGLRSRGGDLCPGCLADLVPGVPGAVAVRAVRCGSMRGLLARLPATDQCDECVSLRARERGIAHTLAVIDYAYPGDMLITALKERGRIEVAAMLGRLIAQAVCSPLASLPPLGAIVPVPAAPASLRRRGVQPGGGNRTRGFKRHWRAATQLADEQRAGSRLIKDAGSPRALACARRQLCGKHCLARGLGRSGRRCHDNRQHAASRDAACCAKLGETLVSWGWPRERPRRSGTISAAVHDRDSGSA